MVAVTANATTHGTVSLSNGQVTYTPEALFNGAAAFRGLSTAAAEKSDFRFLRFRPPRLEREGDEPTLPHIRLDRALQFLIGDKLS